MINVASKLILGFLIGFSVARLYNTRQVRGQGFRQVVEVDERDARRISLRLAEKMGWYDPNQYPGWLSGTPTWAVEARFWTDAGAACRLAREVWASGYRKPVASWSVLAQAMLFLRPDEICQCVWEAIGGEGAVDDIIA